MPPRSPLAPPAAPALPPIAGVTLATKACGIRYRERADVCLMRFAPGTAVAGVLTRSLTAAAPVDLCRAHLQGGKAQAAIINAGNANAFTGAAGMDSARHTAARVSGALGCATEEVYVASTGVIGEPLPDEKITAAIDDLVAALAPDAWMAAAEAIMTTDTFPKLATRTASIGGTAVTINGIAKGSGMIGPDMATLLAFVATDAKLPAKVLRPLLQRGADRSFNATTVDGDTSTNDTLLIFATGRSAAHPEIISAGDRRLAGFRKALEELLIDLATQVVRDGEGASKLITVDVTGAASPRAAKRIALSIANSPLVKTAIAGQDANWGRIVMAVGKSGEKADRDRLRIAVGGIVITENGRRRTDYDERPVAEHMTGQQISIAVDVGVGRGKARVWTCDLTHGYIDINAHYRS
jgi:glutamate N-acetyltransferase/amino-acid N-acetyltransferase